MSANCSSLRRRHTCRGARRGLLAARLTRDWCSSAAAARPSPPPRHSPASAHSAAHLAVRRQRRQHQPHASIIQNRITQKWCVPPPDLANLQSGTPTRPPSAIVTYVAFFTRGPLLTSPAVAPQSNVSKIRNLYFFALWLKLSMEDIWWTTR